MMLHFNVTKPEEQKTGKLHLPVVLFEVSFFALNFYFLRTYT